MIYKNVAKFHKAMGVPAGNFYDREFLKFRLRLESEEFLERLKAAGFMLTLHDDGFDLTDMEEFQTPDPVNFLKEGADLSYVLNGTFVSLGWDFPEAERLVHESNMSKLSDDGKPVRRPDGKIMKGPNYKAPVLDRLVEPYKDCPDIKVRAK